jgi:dienelactone hydrolase
MPLDAAIDDFKRRDLVFSGKAKPVLVTGTTGLAVIVLHEIFGFTPPLARFCRWIRDAGFRVYAPILLGTPDATNPQTDSIWRKLGLCISREINIFATGQSSPIVDWLKELARLAHQECGGRGVGAVGMCLTGNFALAMAVDPAVLAPVVSQPGLPPFKPAAIGLSEAEIGTIRGRVQRENMRVRGYRFAGDSMCRAERFDTLGQVFGEGFIGTTFPDSAGNPSGRKPPHGVFTGDLIDAAGEPTRRAVDEVIALLREKL